MRELNNAAKFAAETKDTQKNYYLACIALRKDGTIVRSRNATISKEPVPCAHAEARVLRKAGFGSTLWVARVLKDGTWAMSKPCKNCQKLIINCRVRRVYYTIGPNEYGVWDP